MAVLLSGSGRTLDNFHERIEQGTLNARIPSAATVFMDIMSTKLYRDVAVP